MVHVNCLVSYLKDDLGHDIPTRGQRGVGHCFHCLVASKEKGSDPQELSFHPNMAKQVPDHMALGASFLTQGYLMWAKIGKRRKIFFFFLGVKMGMKETTAKTSTHASKQRKMGTLSTHGGWGAVQLVLWIHYAKS